MIPWFVITLAEEPWKLARTLEHLRSHGIVPTVIHGINGQLAGLRPMVPHEMLADGTYQFMHPAQLGCVLSHIIAMNVGIAHGAQQFVIAEDDVVLCDNFQERFDTKLKELPENVGILQMQHINRQFGTACILWRADAAHRALQMLRPLDSPFDIILIRKVYPFIGHLAADPPLARERTSAGEWPSSVQQKPWS